MERFWIVSKSQMSCPLDICALSVPLPPVPVQVQCQNSTKRVSQQIECDTWSKLGAYVQHKNYTVAVNTGECKIVCVLGLKCMKWKVSFYMLSPKLRSGFEWNLVIDVLTTVTMKLLFSGMWSCRDWWKWNDVWEDPPASIIRVNDTGSTALLEMSVHFYQTTWGDIQDNRSLYS
jgi:hypothetical protein